MTSKVRTLLYILLVCAVLILVDLLYLSSHFSSGRSSGFAVRRGSADHGSRWSSNNAILVSGTIAVPINRNTSGNDSNRSVHDHHPNPNLYSPSPPKHKHSSNTKLVEVNSNSRSEYTKPNMNCTIAKSRQRMVNTYGDRFNSSLPPFLGDDVSSISTIFNFPPPFGFSGAEPGLSSVLKHLPEKGLPPELLSKPCLRCVVVGNGGILRRSGLGGVIDNFDMVIRMNDAPTKKHENDVGTKTNIRIFYPESAPRKERDYAPGDWLFLMMAFKSLDLKWLETMALGKSLTSSKGFWAKPATRVPKPAKDFRLLNAAIVQETAFDIIGMNSNDGKMKGNVPTTGSIAIMLSIRLCDEVAVAGFSYDLNDPHAPIHYYDNQKMSEIKKSWTHDIPPEKVMLRKLVHQGIITDLTGGIR